MRSIPLGGLVRRKAGSLDNLFDFSRHGSARTLVPDPQTGQPAHGRDGR